MDVRRWPDDEVGCRFARRGRSRRSDGAADQPRARRTSRLAARPSSTSPTTTSPSRRASSGRCVTGRACSIASRPASPARRSTRSGCRRAPRTGSRPCEVFFPRWSRTADELCVQHPADVVWAVQMSTVEFHPWNSRRDDVEKPDEWRIDLDPMPDATYDDVRRVAHIAHGGARRTRRRRLAEDIGRQGNPHLRAHPAGPRLRRGQERRPSPSPARSSAGQAGSSI